MRAAAERVLARVSRESDDALLTTPVGGIRLIDYLPSRVLELTVHAVDVLAATNADGDVPPGAAAVSLRLIADLAAERGCARGLLRALTGRDSLPPAFNALPV